MKSAIFLFIISAAYAFVPSPNVSKPKIALEAKSNKLDWEKIISTSAVTSALILSNLLMAPEAALAARGGGGRSGGRAGGRAPAMSRPAPTTTRTIQRTTVIQQPTYIAPPVMVSPYGYGGGYGYNPMGGLGLSLGLNAINGVGREIRESGQEREIARERSELEVAKQRQFELEQRLAALERKQ